MSDRQQELFNGEVTDRLKATGNILRGVCALSALLCLVVVAILLIIPHTNNTLQDQIDSLQGQLATMRQEATTITAGHAQRISDLEEIVELQGAQLNSLDPSIELEDPLGIEQSNMDPNSTPGESSDKSYPLVEHFMGLR